MVFDLESLLPVVVFALAVLLWIFALVRRAKAKGGERVLLDVNGPPASDWLVLAGCLAGAAWLCLGLEQPMTWFPACLAPSALILVGFLMFVDNLPAALTEKGVRRGLSTTPWSELAGWSWDTGEPQTLVLDTAADSGEGTEPLMAIPVTDPQSAGNAPETPSLPSPDDYANWDEFRGVIETVLSTHLSATTPASGATAESADT